MMPLLTGLMAEAREIRTPKVWVSQAEKEAQAQHEALRKRIIDLEREIYQLETSLAKVRLWMMSVRESVRETESGRA